MFTVSFGPPLRDSAWSLTGIWVLAKKHNVKRAIVILKREFHEILTYRYDAISNTLTPKPLPAMNIYIQKNRITKRSAVQWQVDF